MFNVADRTVHRATKTLQAISQAIEADQGGKFRQFLEKVIPHMGDAYRGEDSPFRKHLGASVLGTECGRAVWYGFRWATVPHFDARMLRLFNRGHLEEARFIAMLLTIGVQVWQQDENGKQFRISGVGGHFGGSGDGIGMGIPDLPPDLAALLEFKTHNDNSFKELSAKGVREAKFEHYVQMQTYMRKMGLTVALYMAVNKNNDEIWAELVYLDPAFADQFIDRARVIILAKEPPSKIGKSVAWFGCKWCDHKTVCHLGGAPARNCRTCVHSLPSEDGCWECTCPDVKVEAEAQGWEDPIVLDKAAQLAACNHYTPF